MSDKEINDPLAYSFVAALLDFSREHGLTPASNHRRARFAQISWDRAAPRKLTQKPIRRLMAEQGEA
jgi:hypothetical protein